MLVASKLAGPLLITALVVGVLVSLLQTVTQIQEMTLSFVPKVVGMAGPARRRQLDAAGARHLPAAVVVDPDAGRLTPVVVVELPVDAAWAVGSCSPSSGWPRSRRLADHRPGRAGAGAVAFTFAVGWRSRAGPGSRDLGTWSPRRSSTPSSARRSATSAA
jgi:hypothetical protein